MSHNVHKYKSSNEESRKKLRQVKIGSIRVASTHGLDYRSLRHDFHHLRLHHAFGTLKESAYMMSTLAAALGSETHSLTFGIPLRGKH